MQKMVDNHLRIKNDTQYLSQVRGLLSSTIDETDLSREEENKVILAVDEAITNIMEHAYDKRLEGWIDIQIEATEDQITIRIQDSGRQFDPIRVEEPDIKKHVEQGKQGGLGIYLIRKVMDEVKYRFREGEKNEIKLVKYIKGL